MKFCNQCGSALEAGKAFCSNCGAKVNSDTDSHPSNRLNLEISQTLIKEKSHQLNNNKYFYLLSLISSVLLAILPMFDTFEASAAGILSRTEAFYEGVPGFAFFMLIVLLGSAAIAALPFYTDSLFSSRKILLTLVVKVLFIIMFVAVYTSAKSSVQEQYGSIAQLTWTFGGWMTLIFGIAGIVSDIKLFFDLKKLK